MKRYLSFILPLAFSIGQINAQIITTIAGNGIGGISGDGSTATSANILPPYGVAVDTNGNIYISTYGSVTPTQAVSKVRKVNTSGIISTFAGIDTIGFSGDGGPATAARLGIPDCITFDKKGNVYISDLYTNFRVRKVDTAGIITTFAGNGSTTPSGDGGQATAAGLGSGAGIYSDIAGNIYIAAGNKIRKVDTTGIITTFAGTGVTGYSGDGGPATAAEINAVGGQITIDRYGNMYLADVGNNRIRKISNEGMIISTVAGNGIQGYSGDNGPATAAKLHKPYGVFTDNCDNLYIADTYNNVVRVVNGSGFIKNFAGNGYGAGGFGTGSYSGDGGPATAAELNIPNFIYVDIFGSVYISDMYNARVRYIQMDSCRNTTGVASPQPSPGEREVLNVWPNPNDGAFTIHISSATTEPVQVIITNVVGQKVKEITAVTNKDMEVRLDAPGGMYFVSVVTEQGRLSAKVVVNP